MKLTSINPATLEVISEIESLTSEEISSKVQLAHEEYQKWRKTSFEERSKLMKNLANLLREQKHEIGLIMSKEVGKTVAAAEAEVEKSARGCDYYADNAEKFLSPYDVEIENGKGMVRFDPIGVVLAVMPWNFPFWQVFRFVAPALMAGNSAVLKHASNVQLSAREIERVIREAGFPENLFFNLSIGSPQVEEVIMNPHVRAVTLTGSEYAGSQVAMQAGREIKKTVMELGGSDPYIVLEDADLEKAINTAVNGRLQNNAGQSCVASKRFLIHNSLKTKFLEGLVSEVEKIKLGDPLDPSTQLGPLVNEQMVKTVEDQVNKSVEQGAKVLIGGKRADIKGCYYLPTVVDVNSIEDEVFKEEVFAPVWSVVGFDTVEEAVKIANSSDYGLGAVIMSEDVNKALDIAKDIDSGSVFINNFVSSDPRLPFGGVKKSGYGRELSEFGIKEFVNIKAILIK